MDFEVRQRSCKARLPFKCKHCARRFSRPSELQIHSKMHKKNVPSRANTDDREPIPKLLIRRNSSPIKRDKRTAYDDEYEIVDLTSDDAGINSKEPDTDVKPNPSLLCSPSQKDSGIDDSSPQSYDDISDTAEQSKQTTQEPVYSPCLDVKESTKLHNDDSINTEKSCETIVDKSQTEKQTENPLPETENPLPDSTTPPSSDQCYTVQLPTATQLNVENNGNGFITIDINHLKNIVGVGSVTDSDGNIALTLPPMSGDSSRNIFDVINCANKANDNMNENYKPSPKRPRRNSDFDTGDSQFNFYDSNQVEKQQPVLEPAMFTDSESDQDNNDISAMIENSIESGVESDASDGTDSLHDFETPQVTTGSYGKQEQFLDQNANRGDSILHRAPLKLNDTVVKCDGDNVSSSQTPIQKVPSHVLTFERHEDKANLVTSKKPRSLKQHKLSRRFPSLSTSSLNEASPKCAKSNDRPTNVILIDSDTDVNVEDSFEISAKTQKSVGTNSANTSYHSDSSPSKYQSEFAKFLQGTKPPMRPQVAGELPVSCKPNANIFDSLSNSRSVSPTKRVKKIKVEDIINDINNETSPTSHMTLDHSRLDEVQEQSPKQTCATTSRTKITSGPFQTRQSIKRYCSGLRKLQELRQQVMCLVQVLFPRLEYPSYFRSGSICVEVLLDQIIAMLKTKTKDEPVICTQSVPLENVCCNVRVLMPSRTSIKSSMISLRRKICKFLQHVLPNLNLSSSFQQTAENVDELLYQVIECNSGSLPS